MFLFLDDDHNRAALAYQRWPKEKRSSTIWCSTAEDAISVLRDYKLEEVYLDHDLGGEHFVDSRREDCGMEVVRWIEGQNLTPWRDTLFIIHSHNYPAGAMMARRLDKLGLKVKYIPFGTTNEILFDL